MRTVKAAIVLAMLAVASSYPTAVAQEAGILFVAPFDEEPTAVSALRLPCEVERSGAPTVSDPASGSFAPLTASANVAGCSLYGSSEYLDWTLGTVPALLVGRPGHLIATFDGEAVADAAGTGGELWATLDVKLGDASIEGDYQPIVSASCHGTGCSRGHHSGPFVVSVELDALPEVLHAIFRADAGATDATGEASASFTGALQQLVLIPLD